MHHCSEPTVQVLHENQSNFNFDSLDYELALMVLQLGALQVCLPHWVWPLRLEEWMLWEKNTG